MNTEFKVQYHSACTNHLHDIPWDDSANVMACIELTQECNLSCPYCQRKDSPRQTGRKKHKTIQMVEREIVTLTALSKSDAIVLTGGEPLLHPELEAVVQMVSSVGRKPILFTNGILITRERLRALKSVGLFGVLFHINSLQNRPGFEGASEMDLNEMRSELADLAGEFQLHCGFSTLVFPSTLTEVQRIALWASARPDKVHMLTFVAARFFETAIVRQEVEKDVRHSILLSPYSINAELDADEGILSSHDLYDQIQSVFPGYRFNSFLGNAAQSGVLKWAMGTHLCRAGQRIGNLGPIAVRILQLLGRKLAGRDVSHFSPRITRHGWIALLTGWLDRETRKTIRRHLVTAFRKPLELFRTLHLQTFVVMQSIDIIPEGERYSCNGCVQKTTKRSDRCSLGRDCESYVLSAPNAAEGVLEDSAQMQWPRQSPVDWRNSELERIGRGNVEADKTKN
ncbi:MAG: radical SAM protein [Deltaproteobacteria bacterium]|nr:radical SAM protein [Deltaproteobacteria bacterium]